MRVYITGSNSYLGGWLVSKLEDKGHEVIGLDSHGGISHVTNIIPMKDICISKCQAVVPLGWYSAVGNSHPELQEESLKKVSGLIQYIETEKLNVHVVFPSSAAVYGNHKENMVTESSLLLGQCDYSRAKLKAERIIQRKLEGSYTILRLGSLMGLGYPGVRTKRELVVNAFSIDGYSKGKIDVWSPYDWKPVLHVQDAADVIVKAIENPKLFAGIYNACIGSATAIDLAKIVARITGATIDIVSREDALPRSCNLSNRALGELIPLSSLRKIHDTVREFREYVETPNDKNTPWIERELRV